MGSESLGSLHIYEKFADIAPNKILEENLMISCDGTEVIFRVIHEQDNPELVQYVTIDLLKKELKFWNKNINDMVMNKINPYSIEQIKNTKKGVGNLSNLPPCVVQKSYKISHIQNVRRSMIDNRFLVLNYVNPNTEGRAQTTYLNLRFSSVFKLFQFMEIIEQIKRERIQAVLKARELNYNERMY